ATESFKPTCPRGINGTEPNFRRRKRFSKNCVRKTSNQPKEMDEIQDPRNFNQVLLRRISFPSSNRRCLTITERNSSRTNTRNQNLHLQSSSTNNRRRTREMEPQKPRNSRSQSSIHGSSCAPRRRARSKPVHG